MGKMKISDKLPNYKPLAEYSNEELCEFLDNNESTDATVLACICSEILRRQAEHFKKVQEAWNPTLVI